MSEKQQTRGVEKQQAGGMEKQQDAFLIQMSCWSSGLHDGTIACSFILLSLLINGASIPELQLWKVQGSPHVRHISPSNLSSNPSNIDSY